LREWLSPEQLAQYDANSYFDVIGCDSGKRYRIQQGTSMNIHEIDGAGHPRVGWCFVPNGYRGNVRLCACTAKTGPISVQPAITKSDSLSTSPGSAICHSKHALSGVAGLIDSMSPGVRLSASYPLCSHGQAPKVRQVQAAALDLSLSLPLVIYHPTSRWIALPHGRIARRLNLHGITH
jgi:hypothetical protein